MFNFKTSVILILVTTSAQFSDKPYKYGCYNEKDFINHTEYLIDNCYTAFDNKVVQQVIGIPMSTNCASHVANIFLHVYEKSFISKLIDEEEYIGYYFSISRWFDHIWKTYA